MSRAYGTPDVPEPRYEGMTAGRQRAFDSLNFLITNRIPRVALSRFMGWFSKLEQPLLARISLALWRAFADLRLDEAKKTRFRSLHDCFTRELKDGARPADPDPAILASPCDAIVGACGRIEDGVVLQVKGSPYTLRELLHNQYLSEKFRDGAYATLRITSSMYHRFHAPLDLRVSQVTYFSGDAWNVNPPALARVAKLFCKNERAVIRAQAAEHEILLVPVAAVLVASIRLHCADTTLHLRYRGPNVIACSDVPYKKGAEMGWFEHGSTILVFAPRGFKLVAEEKQVIRTGQALMRLP